jgi:hypothetical protein
MAAVAVVSVVGMLAGCGGGDGDGADAAPARVAGTLAPTEVGAGLKLYENTTESTRDAIANAGERSLAADARIWEIRRADRLVGALQITTVLPRVDLRDAEVRGAIARQIIPGAATRIRIDAIEVLTRVVNDKAVFLWFGDGLYEVLQVKDRELEGRYEDVAAAIIRHQSTVPAWKPLPDILEPA